MNSNTIYAIVPNKLPNIDKNNKMKKRNKHHREKGVKNIASDKQVIHEKMQLWTNKEENEYAIYLALDGDPRIKRKEEDEREKMGQEFITSTNPKEEYTHPVAETDYFEDLRHGWEYALRQFIDNYNKQRLEMLKLSSPSPYINKNSSDVAIGHLAQDNIYSYYPIKLIPFTKCTYCNKEFNNEEERKEHELVHHV